MIYLIYIQHLHSYRWLSDEHSAKRIWHLHLTSKVSQSKSIANIIMSPLSQTTQQLLMNYDDSDIWDSNIIQGAVESLKTVLFFIVLVCKKIILLLKSFRPFLARFGKSISYKLIHSQYVETLVKKRDIGVFQKIMVL